MSKTPNMLSAIEPQDPVANGFAETTLQTTYRDTHGYFGIIFHLLNKDAFCSFENNR
jgi:hypothetical protein